MRVGLGAHPIGADAGREGGVAFEPGAQAVEVAAQAAQDAVAGAIVAGGERLGLRGGEDQGEEGTLGGVRPVVGGARGHMLQRLGYFLDRPRRRLHLPKLHRIPLRLVRRMPPRDEKGRLGEEGGEGARRRTRGFVFRILWGHGLDPLRV